MSNSSVFRSTIRRDSGGWRIGRHAYRFRNINARCTSCLHSSRTVRRENLGTARSRHASAHRHSRSHQHLRAGPDDLDGRTPAPVSQCAAHLDGFLDGRVGREHVDRHDHAREAGLVSPSEHSFQRRSDHDRTLRQEWEYPDAHQCHRRSDLSGRTPDQERRVQLNPNPNFNPFWNCEYIEEGENARGEVPSYFPGRIPGLPNTPRSTTCRRKSRLAGPKRCIRNIEPE